jgi:predicted nucleic acid-binding protein
MVLVDTSVWIRFLANREPFASGLDRLLVTGDAAGHEFVFGELLMGDVGGGREKLLADYAMMTPATPISHDDVVAFVQARALSGRGVGWIDAHLLASVLVDGWQLWTADSRLAEVADELGLAYHAPALD